MMPLSKAIQQRHLTSHANAARLRGLGHADLLSQIGISQKPKLSILIVTERLPDEYYAASAVAPLKLWPKALATATSNRLGRKSRRSP